MNRHLFFFILVFISVSCSSIATLSSYNNCVSPIDFGLLNANSGEERYNILLRTHNYAISNGLYVDYKGIDTIFLSIPNNAESIPLSMNNDFSGVVIIAENTKQDGFLFSFINKSNAISLSKQEIDIGDFRNRQVFKNDQCLLAITDNNPWVKNREGYNYGHYRKDILLIKKGRAINSVIMPYNNSYSEPSCKYYTLKIDSLVFSNIILNRSSNSTYKTFLCDFKGVNNLIIRNVTISTPNNNKENDCAISINDCANVFFDDIIINGTYSRPNYSGYGVKMNNVWNFKVKNMYGHGNWGVFGTNNINTASFEKCDINRFDIHCYGKDIRFEDVKFTGRFNQFSSVYGTILFSNCKFINFTPIVNGPSYNAYVGYDLVFEDCYYSKNEDVRLIDAGYIDDNINLRPELKERCAPNVTIKNMVIDTGPSIEDVFLFYFWEKGQSTREISFLDNITIDNLEINRQGGKNIKPCVFHISNKQLLVNNEVKRKFKKIEISGKPFMVNNDNIISIKNSK